ncbi:MAG: sodium-dependent transporter [Pseudomonadota bacterium]
MTTETRQSIHGEWSSHWAFIFAATGAAVGLGNIWKFPYIAGLNGGGAFVLVYLICILIIGIPLLMAEIVIGRNGRQNPVFAIRTLALEANASARCSWIGYLIILSGFLILTYYAVITGWTLDYIWQAASRDFVAKNAQGISALFNQLISNPWLVIFYQTVVIAATVLVISRGIRKGIEKTVLIMFPTMIILLLLLVGYSMDSGHFIAGLKYLFKPNFHELSAASALSALGHAFFTLSLATGSIMMYGAYLPRKASVTEASCIIAAADTGIALLAGIAIFPIVFANHLHADAGPSLIFQTLPLAFGQMPFGSFFATLFFIMLFLAAFTSALSLLEPTVAWMIERFKLHRTHAAIIAGSIIWLLGLGTVFSFNLWPSLKIIHASFFEALDYLTANIMLPLGGLLVAFFTGWLMKKQTSKYELNYKNGKLFSAWRFTLRYISPIAILIIFLNFIGMI